eukprot:g4704.t1
MSIPEGATFEINADSTARATQLTRLYNISIASEAEIDEITLTTSLGSFSQETSILKDSVPPQVLDIHVSEIDYDRRPHTVSFLVRFGEEVYVNTEAASCEVELMPLSAEHPVDELLRRSEACNINLRQTNFFEVFIPSGFNETRPMDSHFMRTENNFYIYVSVFPEEEVTANITLTVPSNSVIDKAGNRNIDTSSRSVLYYPQNQDNTPAAFSELLPPENSPLMESNLTVERWEPFFSAADIGEASAVIVVTSIVLSLVASIANSFLGGNMTPGSVRMLNQAQKLYLTGRLAIVHMPFTYKNFTDQFGWAMFDTVRSSPNPINTTEQAPAEYPRLTIEEGPRIVYTSDSGEHYQEYLNQIVFWIPLLFIVLVIGHSIIVSLLFYYKKDIPSFFTFPRLEIMFGYFSTPITAAASAGLFQGDKRRESLIGLWMLIAFVLSFICLNIFIVWHTFFHTSVNNRRANMFIELGVHNDHDSQFLSKAHKFLTKRLTNRNGTENNIFRRILRLLVTPAGQEGQQHDPNVQVPGPNTPSKSIELVTTPHTPSDFAMQLSGQATQSAGFVYPSTSGDIERAHSHIDENDDEETEDTISNTTTSYYQPYTTTSSESPELDSLPEYKSLGDCCYGCWDWTVLNKILGHPQPSGTWVGNTLHGSQFLSTYGYIFEEYRGPRVIREEETYSVDEHTGRVNRGFLVTVQEPPLVTLCSSHRQPYRIQRFHFQLFFRVFDLLKLVLMGFLVGSIENTANNEGQVITLLVISCLMITLMRITKPFLTRLDMAVGMLCEAADVFVLTLLLIILSTNPRTDRSRFEQIGVAMMVVQCVALAVMVLRHAVSTMSVSITCAYYIRNQNQKTQQIRLVSLIARCCPMYLERKYFDVWMVKTLHKGLNGRRVKASELPRSVAALRYFHELRDRMFRIFSLTKQRI